LIGCATPLWITNNVIEVNSDFLLTNTLPSFAGLLAIGIGDSVAAVVGTNYGKHKWRWPMGSSRSIEGTIAAVLSILGSIAGLSFFLNYSLNWGRIFVATLLSCCLEALTDQIDNIVLPLHFMALLNVC